MKRAAFKRLAHVVEFGKTPSITGGRLPLPFGGVKKENELFESDQRGTSNGAVHHQRQGLMRISTQFAESTEDVGNIVGSRDGAQLTSLRRSVRWSHLSEDFSNSQTANNGNYKKEEEANIFICLFIFYVQLSSVQLSLAGFGSIHCYHELQ